MLGFGNKWFARAFSNARDLNLPSGTKIRVLPPPYFLATKIAAFHHRGAGDFLLSRDVEDVVAVLDGRLEIVIEVQNAEYELLDYLAKQLTEWLGNPDFMDALPGLLPPDATSQARVTKIIKSIKAISTHILDGE